MDTRDENPFETLAAAVEATPATTKSALGSQPSKQWMALAVLSVVIVAGIATVYTAYLLPPHWARGCSPTPKEYNEVLGFTLPPTVLFVLAALQSLGWGSVKMQRAVAITAALVGALSVGASLPSLFSQPQGGTSQITPALFAYISWIFGIAVSFVVVLIVIWNSRHGDSPPTSDSGHP